MIWPWFFAVLFFILAFKSVWEDCNDFLLFLLAAIVHIVVTCAGFGVGVILALTIGLGFTKEWTGPETRTLVSLRDGSGANGNFFLGTGTINTTQYYFFYTEAGNGYQPGKVTVGNNVTIFEMPGLHTGEIQTYTLRFVNPSREWFGLNLRSKKYEITIPEGSLKKNFVLE